jgi:Flp pilus assembly protein TadB
MNPAVILAAAAAAFAVSVVGVQQSASLFTARSPIGDAPDRRRRPLLRRSRQRAWPRADEVADWCDQLARALRSGSSLTAAVVDAAEADAPMSRVVAPIARQVRRGAALAAALDQTTIDPASAAGLALTVLRSCARFGGPAAAPLERAAMTLRARDAVLAEQQVHSAQARLSARVLTLVPVVLLALLVTTDGKVRAAAVTPAGLGAVSLGVVLNAAGSFWMRRIIGRSQ